MNFRFEALYTGDEWISPAYLSTDPSGVITSISLSPEKEENRYENVEGYAIPGFVNGHSHAFQYAMAGMAENLEQGRADDDFWSWREKMYSLALALNPEDLKSIATMLYIEMLRQGFTSVAEFHYLHHDPKGKPYEKLSQMGEALCEAARTAGIELTLIPIFYEKGDFGKEASQRQARFLSRDSSAYLKLWEESKALCQKYGFQTGLGAHSLRAVSEASLKETLNQLPTATPFHLHISEQEREVSDCTAFYGSPPVQWLNQNFELNEQFFLVHATHVNDRELTTLLENNVNVVLCPTTEANLGDGLFPLRDFHHKGGSWSIGTDSHVGTSPMEEIRWADYGQRLFLRKRNPLCSEGEQSGKLLYERTLLSGARAMGTDSARLVSGQSLNAVIVTKNHPMVCGASEQLFSALIYSGDRSMLAGVITRGNWVVKDGLHASWESSHANYLKTVTRLQIRS